MKKAMISLLLLSLGGGLMAIDGSVSVADPGGQLILNCRDPETKFELVALVSKNKESGMMLERIGDNLKILGGEARADSDNRGIHLLYKDMSEVDWNDAVNKDKCYVLLNEMHFFSVDFMAAYGGFYGRFSNPVQNPNMPDCEAPTPTMSQAMLKCSLY
jgi:hypothetical protein